MAYIKFFREIISSDLEKVGYKGLSLAKLKTNFKVPHGFVITSNAYEKFISKNVLKDKIESLLNKLNKNNTQKIANNIQKMIIDNEIPEDIKKQVLEAYESLSFKKQLSAQNLLDDKDLTFVAVRSSYVHEIYNNDLFQISFLNIKGIQRLFTSIKVCWAAQFTAKNIQIREAANISHNVKNAIIIQKMVNADKSIIGYSINPNNHKEDEIYLKAVLGLGEVLTITNESFDAYVLEKDTLTIKEIVVFEQGFKHTLDDKKKRTVKITLKEEGKKQKLDENEIREAARITKRVSNILGTNQRVELGLSSNEFFVLQSKEIRPKIKLSVSSDMKIHDIKIETNDKKKEEIPKIEIIEYDKEPEIIITEKDDLNDEMEILQKFEKEASMYQAPLEEKKEEFEENNNNILKNDDEPENNNINIENEEDKNNSDEDAEFEDNSNILKNDDEPENNNINIENEEDKNNSDEDAEFEDNNNILKNDDEPENNNINIENDEDKDNSEDDDSIFSSFKEN